MRPTPHYLTSAERDLLVHALQVSANADRAFLRLQQRAGPDRDRKTETKVEVRVILTCRLRALVERADMIDIWPLAKR